MNTAISIIHKLYSYEKQLYHTLKGSSFGHRVYFNHETIFESYVNIETDTKLVNCRVGTGTDIGFRNMWCGCKFGRYCVIGEDCKNIVGHHPTSFYVAMNSKFYRPGRKGGFAEEQLYTDEYKYADSEKQYYNIIGNDVYITSNVILLEGVKIGDGAVITPGSVVTKNIPPYAIARGNPAKIETYRFKPEDIQFLLDLKWWDKDEEWIKQHLHNFSNIKNLREQVKKEQMLYVT